MQDRLSSDTVTVPDKGIFGVYGVLLGDLFLQKERDMLWSSDYCLFCETK